MNPPNPPRRPDADHGPVSSPGFRPLPPRDTDGNERPAPPPRDGRQPGGAAPQRNPNPAGQRGPMGAGAQRPAGPPRPQSGGPVGSPDHEDLAGAAGPTLPGGGRQAPPPPAPPQPPGARPPGEDPATAGPTMPKGGRQVPPRPLPPQPPAGPPGAPGGQRPGPIDPAGPTLPKGGRQAPSAPVPPAAPGTPGGPPRFGGPARSPDPWGPGGPGPAPAAPQAVAPGPVSGEDDLTMPGTRPPGEAAAAVPGGPARKPVRRKDVLISAVLYLVGVAVAFGWAYDLFAKLFDLVHNRCTLQKTDFSVKCAVIRPPASALWGLLIGGGGMFLALVGALVLAAVAAMTGRRAWLWPAIAVPLIAIAGGAGHVLVATAIN
ncbi:hypothetical protein [Nocardia sp. CDC160]|uniref:hypothetical protein n=1 Tax=Nocardia sp. CDC160 TaxID=3112166 RepID=UPI002DB8140C|nr:hypothetical protein [Nocardia sp. CDC160]MEC3914305.1 hypothetical protein [Nocardia sp. CDC160]